MGRHIGDANGSDDISKRYFLLLDLKPRSSDARHSAQMSADRTVGPTLLLGSPFGNTSSTPLKCIPDSRSLPGLSAADSDTRRTVDPSPIGHTTSHLSSACTPFDKASDIRITLNAS